MDSFQCGAPDWVKRRPDPVLAEPAEVAGRAAASAQLRGSGDGLLSVSVRHARRTCLRGPSTGAGRHAQRHVRITAQSHVRIAGQRHVRTTGQRHVRTTGQRHVRTTGQRHVRIAGQRHVLIAGQRHVRTTGQRHVRTTGQRPLKSDQPLRPR